MSAGIFVIPEDVSIVFFIELYVQNVLAKFWHSGTLVNDQTSVGEQKCRLTECDIDLR